MSTQLQPIFKERFLVKLKSDVAYNLHRYEQEDVWVHELATGAPYRIDSRIELPSDFALLMPTDGNLRDLENTRIVYDAMRELSRIQAADPRLLSYMAHDTCWAYMRKRWNLAKSRAGDKKDYVLSHYFIKSDQSRSLLRNGIARLWWYGYLTYDPERENHYELTAILLRLLDIAQQVLERSYGRNSAVLHGFLEFILQNAEDLVEGGNTGRKKIRQLAIALNLHGGVCILDNLNKAEIKAFLSKTYDHIKTISIQESDKEVGIEDIQEDDL